MTIKSLPLAHFYHPTPTAMSIISTLQSTAFTVELQDWAESTTSGQTKGGKMLVIAIFICNLISVILYIIDTNRELMEECISWEELITLQVKYNALSRC